MTIPDVLLPSYLVQHPILLIHFSSNILILYSINSFEILADRLQASSSVALILHLTPSYKLQSSVR